MSETRALRVGIEDVPFSVVAATSGREVEVMRMVHASTTEVADLLRNARDRVEPALWQALQTLSQPVREVCEYHFGWRDADGRTRTKAAALGKVIRPALVFLGAQAVTAGYQDVEGVAAAAAQVELVHNFSLVHDDIMDEDRMRRHRKTVWAVFGRTTGILAGDALLCLGLGGLPAPHGAGTELASAVQCLIHGQLLDLEFEVRRDVDLRTCLQMADLKTAALTAAACAVGGQVGGGAAEDVAALRTYGRHFGLAFQLADDVFGIAGSSAATGKAQQNDLWRRKRSLPVVYALTQDGEASRRLRGLYAQEGWDGDDVAEAADILAGLGAVDWARAQAEYHANIAIDALASRPRIVASGAVPQLEALADFAWNREI